MNEKKPAKPAPNAKTEAAPAQPHSALTPEAEANARIKDLQGQIVTLQKDVRMTEGRFTNRSPEAMKTLEKENQELRARLTLLEKALLAIANDSYRPRRLEEEKIQYEALRLAAVEFCKKANVDPEIWKNLVS
ncbi:MAG: hypothetical protein NDJ90_10475 [Oligoflexia bacterium]|nr:hypothetical protein [Oligoflexia bacterium]